MSANTTISISAKGGDVYINDQKGGFDSNTAIEYIPESHIIRDGITKQFAVNQYGGISIKLRGLFADSYRSDDESRAGLTLKEVSATIGSKSCVFSINTMQYDALPNRFTFQTINDAQHDTEYTSGWVTVDGMSPDIDVPVSVTGGMFATGDSYNESGTVRTSFKGDIILQLKAQSPAEIEALKPLRLKLVRVMGRGISEPETH